MERKIFSLLAISRNLVSQLFRAFIGSSLVKLITAMTNLFSLKNDNYLGFVLMFQ